MALAWRLRDVMTMRRIRSSAELHRRLQKARGPATGLSKAQVNRLTDPGAEPERLNLDTLEALCDVLQVTPAELLTRDIIGVPTRILQTMLVDAAVATAHHELCTKAVYDLPASIHPGDPFGRVLAWLWRSGQDLRAMELVADYLAECRQHNAHAPKEGARLTWSALRQGIPMAINVPHELSRDELAALLGYLDLNLPGFYGLPIEELNQP